MSENIFQILLLLSYLNIALISVTIAVYAISVSYLGRETSRSILRKRRREEELKETVKKLGKRLKDKREIDAIEREIEMVQKDIAFYKKQQKSLGRNLFWLSIKGAVLAPNVFFSLSVLASVIGILEVLQPEILLALSSILVVIGGLALGKALMATEQASLGVPKPKFDAFFLESELMTRKCKAKVDTRVRFGIHNVGDASAEDIVLVVYIPKRIKVKEALGRWQEATLYSEEKVEFASCCVVEVPSLVVDSYYNTGSIILVPNQTGTYKILMVIKEKSTKTTHELTLTVE